MTDARSELLDLVHQATNLGGNGQAARIPPEARDIGETAAIGVTYVDACTREIHTMLKMVKRVASDIEREGLELIALVQTQHAAFNARVAQFTERTATLHDGLRDTFARMVEGSATQANGNGGEEIKQQESSPQNGKQNSA